MHIVIVGAGAAGLSAARRIAELQPMWHVTILEARSRPGGRTHTCDISSEFLSCSELTIELGGEFIHGGNTSTARLAAELGLTLVPVPRLQNMKYNKVACHHTQNPKIAQLKATYENIVNQKMSSIDYTISLRDALLCYSPEIDVEAIRTADVLFAQTWCADIQHLSVGDLREEAEVDVAGNDEYRILEGYAELWKRVIANFADNIKIQYNTIVTGVAHSPSHGQSIVITTTTVTLCCNAAIVTVPSAVLSSLRFSPPLPSSTQDALTYLRTAAATKAFLILRHHEVLAALTDMTYLCNDDPAVSIPRWWTPRHGMPTPYININGVLTKVIVVCGYATDSRAVKYDSLSEEEARKTAISDIGNMLGIDSMEISPLVVFFKRVSWAEDIFAGGGYASIPPTHCALKEHVSIRQNLAQPVYDHRVWFAGEACTYLSNRQTVHGAFDTGKQAAEELVERLTAAT